MGNKKKLTGRAAAGRRAATTGIQHKYDQTTAFWREIEGVHNRPTEATRGPHIEEHTRWGWKGDSPNGGT